MDNQQNNTVDNQQENSTKINENINPQNDGKNTNPNAEDKPSIGLSILSFILPLIGFILAAINWKSKPISAKRYLIVSAVSFALCIFFNTVVSSSVPKNSNIANSEIQTLEEEPAIEPFVYDSQWREKVSVDDNRRCIEKIIKCDLLTIEEYSEDVASKNFSFYFLLVKSKIEENRVSEINESIDIEAAISRKREDEIYKLSKGKYKCVLKGVDEFGPASIDSVLKDDHRPIRALRATFRNLIGDRANTIRRDANNLAYGNIDVETQINLASNLTYLHMINSAYVRAIRALKAQ